MQHYLRIIQVGITPKTNNYQAYTRIQVEEIYKRNSHALEHHVVPSNMELNPSYLNKFSSKNCKPLSYGDQVIGINGGLPARHLCLRGLRVRVALPQPVKLPSSNPTSILLSCCISGMLVSLVVTGGGRGRGGGVTCVRRLPLPQPFLLVIPDCHE